MSCEPQAFPLLSIVTINKNNSTGLARTLKSFAQIPDPSPIEFIFIDGQSSDNSLQLAANFYPQASIYTGRDAGVYDAMNKGLRLSSGRFVLWINSGDEIIPSSVDLMVDIISSTTAVVTSFSVAILEENDSSISKLHIATEDQLPHRWLAHPGVIYLRSALVHLGGYLTLYKITADHESLLALRRGGAQFHFSAIPISRFYAGGLSSTWHAELEREKLNFDYNLADLGDVYRRCRRWLGVPKSVMYSIYVLITAPFRRIIVYRRIQSFERAWR